MGGIFGVIALIVGVLALIARAGGESAGASLALGAGAAVIGILALRRSGDSVAGRYAGVAGLVLGAFVAVVSVVSP
jgi:hypothetical protein